MSYFKKYWLTEPNVLDSFKISIKLMMDFIKDEITTQNAHFFKILSEQRRRGNENRVF